MFCYFKNILLGAFFWLAFSVCYAGDCDNLNPKTCSILKGFRVADQNHNLHFKHKCSDLDNHNQHSHSAYAFFESLKFSQGKQQKALVLGVVEVGHLSGPPSGGDGVSYKDYVGLNLNLQKMRIEGLTKWAKAPVSLALEMQNQKTKQVITGLLSKTYFYSYQGSGYPEDKKYTISQTGNLNWVKLIEPEEEEKKAQQTEEGACVACDKSSLPAPKRNEYKGSELIAIGKNQIQNPEDPHTLYLVLRNETTGEKLKLKGPDITTLSELFKVKFSGGRILGLVDVLNPLQEGGLWDVISDALKYGDCIHLRKKAKKDFDKRFALSS